MTLTVVLGAGWAFDRPYPQGALAEAFALAEKFPVVDDGGEWSEGRSTSACFARDADEACVVSWVRTDGAGTAFTAFAHLVIVEESSRVSAWSAHLRGPESRVHAGIETAWTEVADKVEGTSADSAALYCQAWPTAQNPDGCTWTYWARYGQYVIALQGGSETAPISADEFVRAFVAPADTYITARLAPA